MSIPSYYVSAPSAKPAALTVVQWLIVLGVAALVAALTAGIVVYLVMQQGATEPQPPDWGEPAIPDADNGWPEPRTENSDGNTPPSEEQALEPIVGSWEPDMEQARAAELVRRLAGRSAEDLTEQELASLKAQIAEGGRMAELAKSRMHFDADGTYRHGYEPMFAEGFWMIVEREGQTLKVRQSPERGLDGPGDTYEITVIDEDTITVPTLGLRIRFTRIEG